MRFLLTILLFVTLTSCGNSRNVKDYSNYVKIVSGSDGIINELSAVSDSAELNNRLNARFQSLSENTSLVSKIPEERIEEKTKLLAECMLDMSSCNYVPEGYSFEIHRNFLNLTYQYNAFSSHDLFYKHAVIDVSNGRRLLYLNLFNDPNVILERYNQQYVDEYEAYLTEFNGEFLSEEEQEEYDVIRNHLNSRTPFQLEALNNFELIFDSGKNRFTEIRFHYNGSGGVYKTILGEGFISFELKEIESMFTKEFKDQLGKI